LHDNDLLTENTKVTKEVQQGVGFALMNTQLLHRLCDKFDVEHDDILKAVSGVATSG
jgi:hypothetical protein